jgi:integrase/recombinase XerD
MLSYENTVKVRFWRAHSKENKAGLAPILCRITCNGVRAGNGFSTDVYVAHNQWDAKQQKVKGNSSQAKNDNLKLSQMKAEIDSLWLKLENNKSTITADRLRALLKGNIKTDYYFVEIFCLYNELIKKRFEAGELSEASIEAWEAKKKNLLKFLQQQLSKDDILISEVTRGMFDQMKLFFLVDLKRDWNYTAKVMASFKRVLQFAVDNDWLNKNPFAGLSMKKKPVTNPEYLNAQEMEKLENFQFERESLSRVRDFFVFCAYTGLSWADYTNLQTKHIFKSPKGEFWIMMQRKKGENQDYGEFEVPMFPKAQKILEKYGSVEKLPKMTNQSFNRFLGHITEVLEFTTDLHCHLARHTFAHWALNILGFSPEVVAAMMGHQDSQMLRVYAKVRRVRIADEWDKIKEKIAG